MATIEAKIIAERGGAALDPPPPLVYNITRHVPITTLIAPQYIRRTLSAWIIELMQGFGAYGFTTFVPLILYSRGYTIVHALTYTAVIQIAYPVGTLISVFITERMQRKWGMALLYTLNVLAGLGFLLEQRPADTPVRLPDGDADLPRRAAAAHLRSRAIRPKSAAGAPASASP